MTNEPMATTDDYAGRTMCSKCGRTGGCKCWTVPKDKPMDKVLGTTDEWLEYCDQESRKRSMADQVKLLNAIRLKTEMVQCDCGLPEGLREWIDAERARLVGESQ